MTDRLAIEKAKDMTEQKTAGIILDLKVGIAAALFFAASVGVLCWRVADCEKSIVVNRAAIAELSMSQFRDRIELAKISTKLTTIEIMVTETRLDVKRYFGLGHASAKGAL